ncbi:hypothetical protein CDAR_465911 [Caerostris darwini]|uniref:CUB domain-containing protein n=1 Tax=Caerostris darwini TaxID=1538125 RepID=A0AAV4W7Y5_9ARAC|nr:hypothetical protein CDAR_465911 [Caerostris darwini]
MKLLVTFIFLFGCLLSAVICENCEIITSQSGINRIYDDTFYDDGYERCWKMPIPAGKFIRLKINGIGQDSPKCADAFIKISVAGTTEEYSFGASHDYKHLITALNNVTVTHTYYNFCPAPFEFIYKIQDIECIKRRQFPLR